MTRFPAVGVKNRSRLRPAQIRPVAVNSQLRTSPRSSKSECPCTQLRTGPSWVDSHESRESDEEGQMRHRCLAAVFTVIGVVALTPLLAAAQPAEPPRTPWGAPDLQGSVSET